MPDYKTTLPFFLVFLLVLSAFGESVIPGSDFEPGWVEAGATKSFYKHDLYGHINGGAELFLEFGFEKLTVQRYHKDTIEIDLEIYEILALRNELNLRIDSRLPFESFKDINI